MKRFLKWTGIILLSLIVVLLLASWVLSRSFLKEFEKVYEIDVASINIPSDSASLERGRQLSVSCRDCHDVDLAGKVFFDDPTIGVLPSSNLTRAKGSETEGYSDLDFVRALRHGLNKQGNALMVMPSNSYTHLSDEDLGCLIAYVKSLPAIERTFSPRRFNYTAKVMAGAGLFGELFPYNEIDHTKARKVIAPPMADTPEYGHYVAKIGGCFACHGPDLGGGVSPDPVSPPVPNISKSGNPGKWSKEQFKQTFRSGLTPEGKNLDGKFMPFAGISALNDVEIEALYTYIQSLPGAEPEK
jgi:mono/diheme cytochrome c family protein